MCASRAAVLQPKGFHSFIHRLLNQYSPFIHKLRASCRVGGRANYSRGKLIPCMNGMFKVDWKLHLIGNSSLWLREEKSTSQLQSGPWKTQNVNQLKQAHENYSNWTWFSARFVRACSVAGARRKLPSRDLRRGRLWSLLKITLARVWEPLRN